MFGWFSSSNVIVLNRGEYTSCAVNLQGGIVTSWRIHNKEQLFVGRGSWYDKFHFPKGGIVHVFPVLGEWEFGIKHGFARHVRWQVEKEPTKLERGDVEAVFSLVDNSYTRSHWCYKFKIIWKLTLLDKRLNFEITLKNTDPNFSFKFDYLMLSYIKVPNVKNIRIQGLDGCLYSNNEPGYRRHYLSPTKFKQESDVIIQHPIERIYQHDGDIITVKNVMQGRNMIIEKPKSRTVRIWSLCKDETKPQDERNIRWIATDEREKMFTTSIGRAGQTGELKPGEDFNMKINFIMQIPEGSSESD